MEKINNNKYQPYPQVVFSVSSIGRPQTELVAFRPQINDCATYFVTEVFKCFTNEAEQLQVRHIIRAGKDKNLKVTFKKITINLYLILILKLCNMYPPIRHFFFQSLTKIQNQLTTVIRCKKNTTQLFFIQSWR